MSQSQSLMCRGGSFTAGDTLEVEPSEYLLSTSTSTGSLVTLVTGIGTAQTSSEQFQSRFRGNWQCSNGSD
jgi:hypothetical protein